MPSLEQCCRCSIRSVYLDNVVATPHIGYVTENLYRAFYEDVVANIAAWLYTQSTAKANPSHAA